MYDNLVLVLVRFLVQVILYFPPQGGIENLLSDL